jgi:hypothetical protein
LVCEVRPEGEEGEGGHGLGLEDELKTKKYVYMLRVTSSYIRLLLSEGENTSLEVLKIITIDFLTFIPNNRFFLSVFD